MAPSDKFVRTLVKPLAWIPVIIINAIISWSYFAYIIIFCFGKYKSLLDNLHSDLRLYLARPVEACFY